MRKKLLALLMCATMVLGTGVTAFASSQDDAKKIGTDNAQKFIDEYYPADEVIKADAYNGSNGTVEYGYIAGTDSANVLGQYDAVVIYKGSDKKYHAATKVAGAGKVTGYELKAVASSEITVGTTTVADVLKKAANIDVTTTKVYAGTVDTTNLVKATTTVADDTEYVDANGNVIAKVDSGEVAAVTTVTDAAQKAATGTDGKIAADTAVTVWDDNHGSSQVVLVKKNDNPADAEVIATEGFVTNTKNYVKYSSSDALLTGSKNILKSTDENSFGTIYASMSAAGNFDQAAVASALDDKVFTKDAVAVKITAYLQTPVANIDLGLENQNIYNGNAKGLLNLTKLQSGQYTFDSDLISRTGFKGAEAVNVFQPTLAASKFDMEAGTAVKDFNKVATVKVDSAITFENDATYVDGIFVFDKGELTEEPTTSDNDGVSDAATTAASANTSASPKTGDVAPIAALAVVMMGACSAMVVASKKRA